MIKVFIAIEYDVPKALCVTMHALTGFFVFPYLLILHLIVNWKSLKSYIPSIRKRTLKRHQFVSVGLFVTLVLLVASSILINIYEAKNDIGETVENNLLIYRYTIVHTISGLIFLFLSIFHLIVNWSLLKSYLLSVWNISENRAVFAAFLVALCPILTAILLVLIFFK
jgi:succinate dehydrogenase/fumarate reductase cytochrome b subunit